MVANCAGATWRSLENSVFISVYDNQAIDMYWSMPQAPKGLYIWNSTHLINWPF